MFSGVLAHPIEKGACQHYRHVPAHLVLALWYLGLYAELLEFLPTECLWTSPEVLVNVLARRWEHPRLQEISHHE